MQGSFYFRCGLIAMFSKSPDPVIDLFALFYALLSSLVEFSPHDVLFYSGDKAISTET